MLLFHWDAVREVLEAVLAWEWFARREGGDEAGVTPGEEQAPAASDPYLYRLPEARSPVAVQADVPVQSSSFGQLQNDVFDLPLNARIGNGAVLF